MQNERFSSKWSWSDAVGHTADDDPVLIYINQGLDAEVTDTVHVHLLPDACA
jgi:hypothetical protein